MALKLAGFGRSVEILWRPLGTQRLIKYCGNLQNNPECTVDNGELAC